MSRLIVVVGPTGSGKTDLSIRLAQHFHAPILSTDSRQFYKGMPIGTAQPDAEQLHTAEHHFIAVSEVWQEYNCGRYETDALQRLTELFAHTDTVIAVGGSGLYVKALCEGLDELPQADAALRESLAARLRDKGLTDLCAELQQRDPVYYERVDRANPQRVLRALEVCIATGKPYSEQRSGERKQRDFKIVKIGVDVPREVLYERINRRVDKMIADGLVDEVRRLVPYRNCNAMQTVGYREILEYIDGHCTLTDAIERIKLNTRHYAKRQMTWFRRDEQVRWFSPDATTEIIDYICGEFAK